MKLVARLNGLSVSLLWVRKVTKATQTAMTIIHLFVGS